VSHPRRSESDFQISLDGFSTMFIGSPFLSVLLVSPPLPRRGAAQSNPKNRPIARKIDRFFVTYSGYSGYSGTGLLLCSPVSASIASQAALSEFHQ
jgi:hypothetical protein